MVSGPCKGCTSETGRSAECHATCEKYIQYKIKYEADKKLKDADRDYRREYAIARELTYAKRRRGHLI